MVKIFILKQSVKCVGGWKGSLMCVMDRPINRFILDMFSYALFVFFLLLSVLSGVGGSMTMERSWYFYLTSHWVTCFIVKDLSTLVQIIAGRITMTKFRFIYNFIMDLLFAVAIGLKVHSACTSGEVCITDSKAHKY